MLLDSCVLCLKMHWRSDVFCGECTARIRAAPLIFRHLPGGLSVFSLFQYSGETVDAFIHMGKQGGNPFLIRFLTQILVRKFVLENTQCLAGVVPIPARCFGARDHAFIMAESASEDLGVPLESGFMARSPTDGPEQKFKAKRDRGVIAFQPIEFPSIEVEGVWLILDDVITTGSTLMRARETLGYPRAVGLTLASTPRLGGPVDKTPKF